MTVRLAILCPGQGAQHAGMFELARTDPAAARCIDDWHLPATDDRFANRHAQPLVVGAACAMWEAVRRRMPPPWVVAGYSVGEVAALAVAGVLQPAQAVHLAAGRAACMDACVVAGQPQTMAAVGGMLRKPLNELLAALSLQASMHVAIENAADQFIVGGLLADMPRIEAALENTGATFRLLPVAVASHTPWLQPAVEPMTALMADLEFLAPATRLLAGISGEILAAGWEAANALALQTAQAVRWSACMDTLAELGVTAALELGPGDALSRMLAARHPGISCRSVAQFRSLAGVEGWVNRLAG